jgi:hypothetical protein
MKRLILALAMVVMVSPAWGGDANGKYMVLAYGNDSCGKWTKEHARSSETSRHHETWIIGFISAYNRETPGIVNLMKGIDYAGWVSWIDNYCKDNPIDDLDDAASALVTFLIARNQ